MLIDEIGYVEVEPVQAGLFFTLMHERHKKKPTLITSNLGFAEWGSFLKNDHLTAALIDRLTENSHVINMKGCKSLRAPAERRTLRRAMTFGQRRELANRLRDLPLERVLPLCGGRPDRNDHRKWHTPAGTLSVTGAKFMNWTLGHGRRRGH